jgi:hypothetical protein
MKIRAKVFQARGGHRAPSQRLVTHRLTKTRGYCPTGSRYMTRANVRDLFRRVTQYAIVRNDGSQRYPRQARPIRARVTETRLRIGCHVWSGRDLVILRIWALGT